MKLRYKLAGVLLVIVGWMVWQLKHPVDVTIPKDTDAIVSISHNKITTTTKTGSKITPNYGHGVTVDKKKDGVVVIKPRTFGLSNDFGISTDFRSVGVGVEFLYYRRWCLLGGTHFINLKTQSLQLHFYTGVGYRLPWAKVNNLTTYLSIDTERVIRTGLFLRIGNS